VELGAELSQVRWSSFRRLRIDFEKDGTPDFMLNRSSRDPLTARVGAESWLPRAPIALRAGISFDQSASTPDTLAPSAPDAHRLGLAAGLGGTLGRAKLDVGYLYTHFFAGEARTRSLESSAPPKGTYRTRVHALSLTLTLR
jgi:long-subunit fatty acid transport protein